MHHPAIGDGKGPRETLARQIGDDVGGDLGDHRPGQRGVATQRHDGERAEAESDGHVLGREPPRLDQGGDQARGVLRLDAEIEIDGDPRVQINIVERGADRSAGRGQGVAVIADGALKHELKRAGAVVQIFEQLLVGGCRVGQVDALHDRPGRAGGAAFDPARLARAWV